jgi:predicted nuclease of predicted toxin-antitoxin system
MSKFLANENVPADAVDSARRAGHDVSWIKDILPGASDIAVLNLSLMEGRVLVTFDKDFGELAFRSGKEKACGVILLRPRLRSPEHLARFLAAVLAEPVAWEGHFSTAQEGKLRVVPIRD